MHYPLIMGLAVSAGVWLRTVIMEISTTLRANVALAGTLHLSGILQEWSLAFTCHVLIELMVRPILLLLLCFCNLCIFMY